MIMVTGLKVQPATTRARYYADAQEQKLTALPRGATKRR